MKLPKLQKRPLPYFGLEVPDIVTIYIQVLPSLFLIARYLSAHPFIPFLLYPVCSTRVHALWRATLCSWWLIELQLSFPIWRPIGSSCVCFHSIALLVSFLSTINHLWGLHYRKSPFCVSCCGRHRDSVRMAVLEGGLPGWNYDCVTALMLWYVLPSFLLSFPLLQQREKAVWSFLPIAIRCG